jgi:acid stress chaperone HdeB
MIRLDVQATVTFARPIPDPSRGMESMRKANQLFFGLLLASAATATAVAQTTIDVSKITCEQLILLQVPDPDHLAIWLNGYYSGKRNTTTINVEQLKENARKVRSYCLSKGKGTVMEAVEAVVEQTR